MIRPTKTRSKDNPVNKDRINGWSDQLTSNTTQIPLTESNETLHTGRTLKNIRHVFFYTCLNSFLRVKTLQKNQKKFQLQYCFNNIDDHCKICNAIAVIKCAWCTIPLCMPHFYQSLTRILHTTVKKHVQ